MKLIRVTNDYFSVDCIVDLKVYNQLNLGQYDWYAMYSSNNMRVYTYSIINGRSEQMPIHRLLVNCPKGMVVDHINGNGLDNRLKNLRVCTRSQNNLNIGKAKYKNHSSKYLGVSYSPKKKSKNHWNTYISIDNKTTFLGSFDNEIEAAKYRDKIALQIRGQYARLNFKEKM